MISGTFERLSSFLTCHEQLPVVLDIARASLYISSRWLDGKMGTKMSSQPAQMKTKFFYDDVMQVLSIVPPFFCSFFFL